MKKETKEKLERALLHFILSAAFLILVLFMQDKSDVNLLLFIIITLSLLVSYLITKLWGSQIIGFIRKNIMRFIIALFLDVIGFIIYFL